MELRHAIYLPWLPYALGIFKESLCFVATGPAELGSRGRHWWYVPTYPRSPSPLPILADAEKEQHIRYRQHIIVPQKFILPFPGPEW